MDGADQIGASLSEPPASPPEEGGLWLEPRRRLIPAASERRGAWPRPEEERALCLSGWMDGAAMYASAHPARESASAPPTRMLLLELLLDVWRSVIQDMLTVAMPVSLSFAPILLCVHKKSSDRLRFLELNPRSCELQRRNPCFRKARGRGTEVMSSPQLTHVVPALQILGWVSWAATHLRHLIGEQRPLPGLEHNPPA